MKVIKMSTDFAKEFKLYENVTLSGSRRALLEARSVADIEAEIAKLQQELEQAKVAEKRASYNNNLPQTVWVWDMYVDPADKGDWVSLENDTVFETKEAAIDAGCLLLSELDDEGELGDDDEYVEPDDYTVDAYEIPIWRVSDEVLEWSGLVHLVDSSLTKHPTKCPKCRNVFQLTDAEKTGGVSTIECPFCKAKLKLKAKAN
jgi:hypothetical protein